MDKFRAIRRVLLITLALNLLATLAKMWVGYLTGSLSIVAGGFDSLFDSASNVIGLVGISFAVRPPDEEHPYGHRKFETLAAIGISLLLFVTCVEIVQSAAARLTSRAVPQINLWSFAALFFSMGVQLFTTLYERRRGRELKSEFLLADAGHTSADIYITLSVIVGLIFVRLGYPIVDALLALGIAGVIAKIGIDIIRSSSAILMDRAMVSGREIERLVMGVEGVESCHRIRSRGPEDDIHIDLHIHVAPETLVDRAHAIAHEVQQKVVKEIPGAQDVVVHVEPRGPKLEEPIGERIRSLALRMGARVHEIRVHQIEGAILVDLHLEVDESWRVEEAHGLAGRLEGRMREEIPEIAEVYVHMEPMEALEGGELLGDEELVAREAEKAVREMGDLKECREVSVRRSGEKLFVSLNCVLSQNLPIGQAHEVSIRLERRLKERLENVGQVLIHLEPPLPIPATAEAGRGEGGEDERP
ncbi:MAG: cation-efflux pump [Anaerolineae bacterium]